MGEHFVLMVDRLLTESTLEATTEGGNGIRVVRAKEVNVEAEMEEDVGAEDARSSRREVVECRICQEEEERSNMESPCSCSGSLKYAHRKCVQRWCNEKGDTTCEICLQPFKPGYSSPPKISHHGHAPMSFRESRQDLNNPHLMTTFPRDAGGY